MRLWLCGALLVALASSAQANGTYFTETVGTFDLRSEMGDVWNGGSIAARLALGHKVDDWAVELGLGVYDFRGRGRFGDRDYDALSWGLDVRRIFPINDWAQAYLRGGIRQLAVNGSSVGSPESDALTDYGGRGVAWGGGLQAGGKIPVAGLLWAPLFFCNCGPKMTAVVTLDWTNQLVKLSREGGPALDGRINSLMLGFALGSDF